MQTFLNASGGPVAGTAEPWARPERFACLGLTRVWLMPFWVPGKRAGTVLLLGISEQIY